MNKCLLAGCFNFDQKLQFSILTYQFAYHHCQLCIRLSDRTCRLWDYAAGRELRTYGLHPNNVNCVKFVVNQPHLFYSVSNAQVRYWDTRTHECTVTLKLVEGGILLIYNKSDKQTVSKSVNNKIPTKNYLIHGIWILFPYNLI